MADSPFFTSDGYWIIGAEAKATIPQTDFPPDIVAMIDLLTAWRYWPYLPRVDLDLMEQHHPGAKDLITELEDSQVFDYAGSAYVYGQE